MNERIDNRCRAMPSLRLWTSLYGVTVVTLRVWFQRTPRTEWSATDESPWCVHRRNWPDCLTARRCRLIEAHTREKRLMNPWLSGFFLFTVWNYEWCIRGWCMGLRVVYDPIQSQKRCRIHDGDVEFFVPEFIGLHASCVYGLLLASFFNVLLHCCYWQCLPLHHQEPYTVIP